MRLEIRLSDFSLIPGVYQVSKSPGEFSPVKVKLHQSVEFFWNHISFFDIVVYII